MPDADGKTLLPTECFVAMVASQPKSPVVSPCTLPMGDRTFVRRKRYWRTTAILEVNRSTPVTSFILIFSLQNRMTAAPGKGDELELYWKSRETTLLDSEGFVGFSFLRRDDTAKGKGKVRVDDGA